MQEEMQPNWSRAPKGAICWAVDADGRAFYYEADITAVEAQGIWRFSGFGRHSHWSDKSTKRNGVDWRTTKRCKPETMTA